LKEWFMMNRRMIDRFEFNGLWRRYCRLWFNRTSLAVGYATESVSNTGEYGACLPRLPAPSKFPL
jgi:hypothetical protein